MTNIGTSGGRTPFRGAKVMLFIGTRLLVLRRDHTAGIPWPGRLDFPGGGREGAESPRACALRETAEETGLRLDPAQLRHVHRRIGPQGVSHFFTAQLPPAAARLVRFGGEGAGWALMPPRAYVASPQAIPHFRAILLRHLRQRRADVLRSGKL